MTAPYSALGAEQIMISDWVEGRLTSPAVAAQFDAISEGLSNKLFDTVAPNSTLYPFLIYQVQSPVQDVRGVGVVRVMVDTIYLVKVVSPVLTYAPLGPIGKIIDAAMTVPETSVANGGLILASVRTGQFSLTEIAAGKQVRSYGGQYHIQASAQ